MKLQQLDEFNVFIVVHSALPSLVNAPSFNPTLQPSNVTKYVSMRNTLGYLNLRKNFNGATF